MALWTFPGLSGFILSNICMHSRLSCCDSFAQSPILASLFCFCCCPVYSSSLENRQLIKVNQILQVKKKKSFVNIVLKGGLEMEVWNQNWGQSQSSWCINEDWESTGKWMLSQLPTNTVWIQLSEGCLWTEQHFLWVNIAGESRNVANTAQLEELWIKGLD